MSLATEAERVITARNRIRTHCVSLGKADGTENITALAPIVETLTGGGAAVTAPYLIYLDSAKQPQIAKIDSVSAICVSSSATSTISTDGVQIVKNSILYVDTSGLDFGTSIPDFFLYNFSNLSGANLQFSSGITSIGRYFMFGCFLFDGEIQLPSGATSIGMRFMSGCRAFDSPLKFPSSLTSIGDYFMSDCRSFSRGGVNFSLPTGLTSVGHYFMEKCRSFNGDLNLANVTTLGNNFLSSCWMYNANLTLPTAGTIGSNFLENCSIFNKPITLPSNLTTIQLSFMLGCRTFNQPLTIPSSVTAIKGNFLVNCYAFNQPLVIPSGVTEIGNYLLQNCYSFNQPLTIPGGLYRIGAGIMENCQNMTSTLTVEFNPSLISNGDKYLTSNAVTNAYKYGIPIAGTYASQFKAALPDKTTGPYRKLV